VKTEGGGHILRISASGATARRRRLAAGCSVTSIVVSPTAATRRSATAGAVPSGADEPQREGFAPQQPLPEKVMVDPEDIVALQLVLAASHVFGAK
jgi:hypothetical protein